MAGRFIHIRIAVPPAGTGRGARERALLAARPLWPLFRLFQAALRPGTRRRADLVRTMFPMTFAAINRRDWVFLEPYLSRSYEIHTDPKSLELDLQPVYRGRQAIRQMLVGWNEIFRDWRWEVGDIVDGPGIWVGLGEVVGIGQASGVEVRRRIAIVARTLRSGQIASQHMFWEWEDALADAGLPPLDRIPRAP